MKTSSAYALFILCSYCSLAVCQQQILSPHLTLRNATLEDADDIATVMIAAFSPLRFWQYLYQFQEEVPHEHHRCVRLGVVQALDAPFSHVEVIEAPADSNLTVAAAAIWIQHNASYDGMRMPHVSTGCRHKDMNVTRALDYKHKFDAAKNKYLDEVFGSEQLYLTLLGTHPDYQLHGAGSRLLERGIEVGKTNNVNVTLIAQPTAEGFYVHNGFFSAKNISITSADEDESFRYNVMAYNFTSGGL
ncbi:hypothetical protein EJ04DRAFT_578490 [Polyplosphaeria fusca]|uniref:N-acetyltransferase domain-containing protein n=1 Tax=Polyplosphaeria fusca TaxID=682080 RepID=A0A9P4QVU7_9PLEO|nr:hypothetical protein EJ04DRAFT_578490 [Polyplosphaeria fusca]